MAWRWRAGAPEPAAAGAPPLVGRDVAARAHPRRPRRDLALGALAGGLLAALLLAGLRVEIQRHRYTLAELVREERALASTTRELVVRVRALRDPKRLAALAAERGFVRPERVIELPALAPQAVPTADNAAAAAAPP